MNNPVGKKDKLLSLTIWIVQISTFCTSAARRNNCPWQQFYGILSDVNGWIIPVFLLEHVMLHVSTQQEMDQAKLRLIHYTIVWLVSFRIKGKCENGLLMNIPQMYLKRIKTKTWKRAMSRLNGIQNWVPTMQDILIWNFWLALVCVARKEFWNVDCWTYFVHVLA